MFFGLFGKKTPKTTDSKPAETQTKINSEKNINPQTTSRSTAQKSTDMPKPGPNGCADIATRED